MGENGFRAEAIDTTKPHPARIYDYLLGGKDHYEVDREAGEQLVAAAPEARIGVRANRAFLRRAVRHVVGSGVRQILDIGTGLPTAPNVHETALEVAPDIRVAYVDNDPIVHAHAGDLLGPDGTTGTAGITIGILLADLRDPRAILDAPEVRAVIDFDEPVALLLAAVLHFLADTDKPQEIVATLRDALAPGSHLILSHATGDFADRSGAAAVYRKATAAMNLRTRAEIERFFDGFELIDPGVAQVPFWRPDTPPPPRSHEIGFYGGVARKSR
ncbi:SAM-dependent methyltransferase [Streptomyces pseudovenezuelae]|uniref:SAM-dependent methyltransferase n=1 Tax=Streptomyces pseudovenezuelae TaxID=67350 RepID=UPI0034A43957